MTPWPADIRAEWLERIKSYEPDAFRKLFLCEFTPPEMPEVYYFFAPTFRMAETVLSIDEEINPRLPIIRITTDPRTLQGLNRGTTVTTLDPNYEIRQRERDLFREMGRHREWRAWSKDDRAYLRALSRRR
jgi:hypothetical protein